MPIAMTSDGEGGFVPVPPGQANFRLLVVEPTPFINITGLPAQTILPRDTGYDTEPDARNAAGEMLVKLLTLDRFMWEAVDLPYPPTKDELYMNLIGGVIQPGGPKMFSFQFGDASTWEFILKDYTTPQEPPPDLEALAAETGTEIKTPFRKLEPLGITGPDDDTGLVSEDLPDAPPDEDYSL